MNKLFRYIFFLSVLIGVCYHSNAQVRVFRQPSPRRFDRFENQNAQRRIEIVKTGYLRNKLNLAPQQADKFFPLYHEYQQELFNIRKLKRENTLNNTADGTEQINKELFYENEILQVRMKFNDAFLKILSPQQVSELYKAEREFNDELVRSLAERRGTTPTGNTPPPPVPQNVP
jgi:hypothetical protein